MNKSPLFEKEKFSFVSGPIPSLRIMEEIEQCQSEKQTGALSLFLGQVRNDKINGKEVTAIEYSAYKDMALKKFDSILHHLFEGYDIYELRVLHSLDYVRTGDVSLMVLATAAHRSVAMEACTELVDLIKSELPVWGKEVFDDGEHVWKKND